MRSAIAAVAVTLLLLLARTASADDKLKPFAGQLVLTGDTPPASFDDLPAYLAANATKDSRYELLKWDVSFVGVLVKDADRVTFTVSDDKQALATFELTAKRRVVIGHFTATKAAGFALNKPYAVTLAVGKTTVGKAELVLIRD